VQDCDQLVRAAAGTQFTRFTLRASCISTLRASYASTLRVSGLRSARTRCCRYAIYSLYWYNSANTDAKGAASRNSRRTGPAGSRGDASRAIKALLNL
jgi:hypothetical protein